MVPAHHKNLELMLDFTLVHLWSGRLRADCIIGVVLVKNVALKGTCLVLY